MKYQNDKSKTKIKFESGFASSNLTNEGRGILRGNLWCPLRVKEHG